jgi:hypothetical protein
MGKKAFFNRRSADAGGGPRAGDGEVRFPWLTDWQGFPRHNARWVTTTLRIEKESQRRSVSD